MNNKSKAVCAMIILTVAVAFSVIFSISANTDSSGEGALSDVNIQSDVPPEGDVTESLSEDSATSETSDKYCLIIEGDKLCAYRIGNNGKSLVATSALSPLIEADEAMKLKNGVYADSFEDLCLYFEAYTS